jgi:hypothetical protein
MWVPLVFHCTKIEKLDEIFEAKCLRPSPGKTTVSFTETRLDELDRLRERFPTSKQAALAFPRALLEKRGLFQPAYLRHSKAEVKRHFQAVAQSMPEYIELEDDLGALQEVRVPGEVPITDAVWILSSVRNEETEAIDNPSVRKFADSLGIACSFWRRNHQDEMLSEDTYYKTAIANGLLTGFHGKGQFYFLKDALENHVHELSFPAGDSHPVRFQRLSIPDGWRGPCTFFQIAEFLYGELQKHKQNGANIDIVPRINFTKEPPANQPANR